MWLTLQTTPTSTSLNNSTNFQSFRSKVFWINSINSSKISQKSTFFFRYKTSQARWDDIIKWFSDKVKNAPSSHNNWWSKTFSRHWAFSFYPTLCNQEFNKCAFSSILKHTMCCVFKFLCQQTQPFLTSLPENWNISASKGRSLHPILFFRLRQTRRK